MWPYKSSYDFYLSHIITRRESKRKGKEKNRKKRRKGK